MPGGALTVNNTQMMRDNGTLHKFPEVIKAMREVVEKGGYGTSVTPVYSILLATSIRKCNVWTMETNSSGYGKMVLGYFGKTPVEPDAQVVKLAAEKLKTRTNKRKSFRYRLIEMKRKKISVWKQKIRD